MSENITVADIKVGHIQKMSTQKFVKKYGLETNSDALVIMPNNYIFNAYEYAQQLIQEEILIKKKK